MAARALAAAGGEGRGGSVSACESYLPMGKLTRRVLRANGMENKVKLFHKRSDDLRVGVDLDSRADILVTSLSWLRCHIIVFRCIEEPPALIAKRNLPLN
jgi:protein arginine N-methyltransferase 7